MDHRRPRDPGPTSQDEATEEEWDCDEQGHEFITVTDEDNEPTQIECERCMTTWPIGDPDFVDEDVTGGPEQPWDRF